MKRGFYTIMAAQFFSSLADNALFVAAVELIKVGGGREWQRAALVPMFALFYVILAPFVGAFADSQPKGRVMFISNAIKMVGCALMLVGTHPLLAYAVVGLGAAAYSPAKYGILTELLPASLLVKANGWIEGLTIASIILGVLLGGQLIGHRVSSVLLSFDFPFIETSIHTPPQAAIAVLIGVYSLAAWLNLRIPLTGVEMRPMARNFAELVPDFLRCNSRLWHDKLGQISLSTTTLFWGVSGNLRYIVLAWSAVALGYSMTQASSLIGVIALGTAVGLLLIVLNAIHNVWLAAPFLILLGGLGGYLVVPMNALLQHRGHNLMGAGRSIAVQNFNEQACILILGALYSLAAGLGLSAFAAITGFGLMVAVMMWLIGRRPRYNCKHYADEVEHLLEIARSDVRHG